MTGVQLGATTRQLFDDLPMSRMQIVAVAVAVALSALDGYDVLSVTFAAPAITHEWGISKAALGVVLSSGLAGMALGSFGLAPLGDLVGRRPLVFGSLILMALGMALSAFATSLGTLSIWRMLTGLGIGALVAAINALAAEYSNVKRRELALALVAMGYPVGGLIGGVLASVLLQFYGWPAVFLTGCGAAMVFLPVAMTFLPESPAFLLARRRPQNLARINVLLRRCGRPALDALPAVEAAQRSAYRAIFSPKLIRATVLISAVSLLYALASYFVLSWMPQMFADAGFHPSTASLASAVASVTGVVGGVALGWAARYSNLKSLTVGAMIGLGLAMIAFGYAPASLRAMTAVAGACGFFLFAGVAGLYATIANSFKAEARASASGFVLGVGRVSSAIAPLLAGWLFAMGLGRGQVSLVFGIIAAFAGIVLLFHARPTVP